MRITSSVEYATRLMVTLARSYGKAPLSADKLSESENVPADYVNQILLRLKRAGLVDSQRGLGGGYSLSRAPGEIRLGQVLSAVEGRIFETVCDKYEAGKKDCRHQGHCGISSVWARLETLIENYFDNITLAGLLEENPEACGKVAAMLDRIR